MIVTTENVEDVKQVRKTIGDIFTEVRILIYKNAGKVVTSFRKQADEAKIMIVYRYFSLCITSFFFLVSDLTYPLGRKMFIITCLFIASLMLSLLYMNYQKSHVKITILVLMEIIGVTVLLIPTGGLESPFVWYSLNTIVVTSILLSNYSCWLSLSFSLSAAVFLTHKIFYYDKMGLLTYFMEKHNLVLCFVLITTLVQMLEKYIKKIQHQSEALFATIQKLAAANIKTKDAMNSLVELYQAVHLLTSQKDRQSVLHLIIHCAKEMAKTDRVCYYSLPIGLKGVATEDGDFTPFLLKSLETSMIEHLASLKGSQELVEVDCCGSVYLLAPVRSIHKLFGILCIEKSCGGDFENLDNVEQVRVFSELCATVLERFELEVVKNRLIISEEQNRIANEIHDGVLQRLFSISCGMFSLTKRLPQIDNGQVTEELYIIRNAIDSAMRELREKIYGMSWKKSGSNAFEVDIKNYIAEVRNLHKVDIVCDISGNQEFLTVFQKKALYRIICEGLGNSLRHGKAQKIDVVLDIKPRGSQLSITDDGLGFYINKETFVHKGLGIKNIQFLANSMEGTAKFNSKMGAGTRIEVTVPHRTEGISKEEII